MQKHVRKTVLPVLLIFAILFGAFGFCAPTVSAEGFENEINPPPDVVPAVQEWTGGRGRFVPAEGMKICYGTGGSHLNSGDRELIREFCQETLGFEVDYSNGFPSSGDIYLLYSEDRTLPEDGYVLDVSSIIKLSARSSIGFYYGMVTFLQSVAAEGSFPVGTARDYPQYGIRSGMLDVARMFIPMEYLNSIVKYFAWFKMNEIHLHINDNGTGFSAFRLESDIEGLTSADGYYTKQEYRDLQKLAERYHISVITEISTPGHSGCFSSIVPDLMLDSSHLDVSNPDTVAFVKSVLGEYIEGSHPVITSGKLHLGADEYPEGYEESLCDYLVELIKYCESKKVTARFWGSLQADVSKSLLENAKRSKAECSFWAPAMLNGQDLLDAGISVINSCASVLNCVPGGNHGFPDYVDIETLYSQWFVRYLGSGASSEASGHVSLIEGASFSLWNDLSYLRGYSRQDVFDRMRYLIAFVAEKTWTGDHTADLTPESFMERFSIVSQLKGQDLPCGIPKTDIQEELASEYEWIGFPYLIEADLVWNGSVGDSVIFGGTEGYLAVDTNGSLYFRREYGFLSTGKTDFGEKQFDGVGMRYDYQLQEGVPTHIALYGTDELTVLVVDGIYAFSPEPISPNGYNQSKTFCVPLRNVGSSGAIVENVEINPYPEEFEDQRADGNLALKKRAVYNGPDAQPAEARALVDGNEDTIFRFSDDADVQDFLVDLGSVHSTNQIAIRFSDHVPAYEVSVSENGEDFELLYRTDSGPEGGEKEDVLQYPFQKGRYFRFRQMRRIQSGEDAEPRGGGVSEFEIYGFDSEKYESVLTESAEWPDDERLNDAVSELRKALLKSRIYLFEVEPLTDRVRERIEELKEEDRIRKDAEESRRIEESVREESIRAEESKAEEEKRNSPLPWILFAVSVLAVAGAVLLFNLRNRSGRRNK